MTKPDRVRLAKVLAILGETFNEPVSELRAEAYALALEDVPIEAIERAAKQCMATAKFFPRPAELRDVIEGDTQTTAELAWMGLLREIRQVGYTGAPTLPEATWAVVHSLWGSWRRLCEILPADGPEFLGWHKQFLSAYSASVARPALISRADAVKVLHGITERLADRRQSGLSLVPQGTEVDPTADREGR